MFSMSRSLRDLLDVRCKTEKQGYTFRGTAEEGEIRTFCAEENVVYDDFVRAKITNEILYLYLQLLNVFDMRLLVTARAPYTKASTKITVQLGSELVILIFVGSVWEQNRRLS
jgi:hypothetical protein